MITNEICSTIGFRDKATIILIIISSLFFVTCKKESVVNIAPEYQGIWIDTDKCSGFSTAPILTIDHNSSGVLNILNSECHSKKHIQGAVKLRGKHLYIGSQKFEIIQGPTKIDSLLLKNNGGYSYMEMVLEYKEPGFNVGNRFYHYYKLN